MVKNCTAKKTHENVVEFVVFNAVSRDALERGYQDGEEKKDALK